MTISPTSSKHNPSPDSPDGRGGSGPSGLSVGAAVGMEQMQYNLLFRWFVGLDIDDPVWVPTVSTKNRVMTEAGV